MKKILAKVLPVLLAASLAVPVCAGPFSVTPVRIYMAPKDKAVAVTITNEGDDELVMQADVYTWKQKPDGEDELVLTEDMLLSPPHYQAGWEIAPSSASGQVAPASAGAAAYLSDDRARDSRSETQ